MTEEIVETKIESRKQNQNLLAVSIILGGLFAGSLLVDFVQLVSGEGFSSFATKTHNVLETNDKTWVGYADPKVELTIITDKNCDACDSNEALVWLRRVVPTIDPVRIDIGDDYGSRLAERFGVVTLPAFIFGKDILHTNFYSQASSLFAGVEGQYFFDMSRIGLPAGRYLKLPTVGEGDIVLGNSTAPVTIVTYTDFECIHCGAYRQALKQAVTPFGDQVRVVYKHLPLSFHAQAENAAMASQCAYAQGKFDTYADYLFTKQTEWAKTKGTQKFKDYAWWLKLDGRAFATCLDKGEAREKIVRDKEEAGTLRVTATPATFVNDAFLDGAVSVDDIRTAIESVLAK